MFDGYIEENTGVSGGGIYISNAGVVNMSGGAVLRNTATGGYVTNVSNGRGRQLRGGGGVYLHNSDTTVSVNCRILSGGMIPTFNMTGGRVEYNTAPNGGGLFWLPIALESTSWNALHLRHYDVRETELTRVTITGNAIMQNNIATHGTRVDDGVWGRHRAENPTVNWGGNVTTRHVPSYAGGMFQHLFNNHDIKTWYGPGTATPTQAHTVTFHPGSHGTFECGNAVVIELLPHNTVITDGMIPTPEGNIGWTFTQWAPSNPLGHTVTGDITFTALYATAATFTLSFMAGESGQFSGGLPFVHLEVVTEGTILTDGHFPSHLVANEGYIFYAWLPTPILGVPVTGNLTFMATYVPDPYFVGYSYFGTFSEDLGDMSTRDYSNHYYYDYSNYYHYYYDHSGYSGDYYTQYNYYDYGE